MITIVVYVYGYEDKIEELRNELYQLVMPTKLEEGNITFTMCLDEQDPCKFVFFEQYVNEEEFQRHLNSSYVQKFSKNCEERNLLSKPVEINRVKKIIG